MGRLGSARRQVVFEEIEDAALVLGTGKTVEVKVGSTLDHPEFLGFMCRREELFGICEGRMSIDTSRDDENRATNLGYLANRLKLRGVEAEPEL